MCEEEDGILLDNLNFIKSNQPGVNNNLSEAQIEYTLIIVLSDETTTPTTTPTSDNNNSTEATDKQTENNSTKTSEERNEAEIQRLYDEMINYVEEIAADYIWNNERFYLDKPIRSGPSHPGIYTSSGCLDYGDNVEDEWFIVYLLFKLTKKFPNLVAKCGDSDGEFLLIHAANCLPEWASQATNMANRVFIYQGMLHLVPPAHSPAQVTFTPQSGALDNFIDPVRTVVAFPQITRASASIQDCLGKKLALFDLTNYSFHRATCLIPTKLAILLKNNPNLIAKAINRFCDKDPADLKLCRTLNAFKPLDMINYRVLFTKHLYSKLKYCDFKPDKRHQWPVAGGSGSVGGCSSQTANSLELEAKEKSLLGFKLTCAFEVLSKVLLQSDKSLNRSFDAYLRKLKNLGYFRNYLENSKKFNELYEIAKESFDINTHQISSRKTAADVDDECLRIGAGQQKAGATTTTATTAATTTKPNLNQYAQLMDSIYLDKLLDRDYVVKIKEEISSSLEKEKDDSEEWLCVEAPQLDDYLEMYSRGDVSSTYDFRLITNAIKNFINERPGGGKRRDLIDGVDFKPVDKRPTDEDVLVDFNVDSIEENIKEYLKKKQATAADDKSDEDDDDEDEDDSFYAVGDDLNEVEDSEDYETNKLSDSLKNYMSSMDEELREQKNLSRLDTNTSKGSSKQQQPGGGGDDLDIDLNLVTNALESYSSQLGLSGPVSNILKSLGI